MVSLRYLFSASFCNRESPISAFTHILCSFCPEKPIFQPIISNASAHFFVLLSLFQRCLLSCFLFVLAKNVSLNFSDFINHYLWFASKSNQNKNLSFFSLRFHKKFRSLFLIHLSPFLLCHLITTSPPIFGL